MTQALKLSLAGLGLMVLLVAAPARAAEEATPQTYIMLVGVDQFADAQIKGRAHAEADAQALYDVFTAKDHLGIDAQHIKLLLGKSDEQRRSEPATRENFLKALHWLATKPNKSDLVILGIFTEGAPLGERVCYFTSDSTFKDRAKKAVTAAEIENELNQLKSQSFCLFLDVNFKGFQLDNDEKAPDLNLQNMLKEFLGKDEEGTHEGRNIFLANSGDKPSLELEQHGLFAHALLDALKGAADTQGYEPDGVIVLDELADYLKKKGLELTRKHGKTKEERERGIIVGQGGGSQVILTRNPKAMPQVTERLAKLAKLAGDKEISATLLEEGQRLLGRMPKLEAHRTLRKRYQDLTDGKLALAEFNQARQKILDGLKFSRDDALAFASKIVHATGTIQKEYVKETKQGDLVGWAVRGLFQAVEEKIPKDIKDRLEKVKELEEKELTILLADARERLGHREDLDKHKDIDVTLQQMLRHLDPYTTYVDPETLERFRQETDATFTGIGIQIRKDTDRDMLKVVTPIKDSPAYKAGIKTGDVVTQIKREMDSDGKKLDPPEIISTKGLPLSDAVKKILGKPKTKVKITVEREGESEPKEFEITRDTIDVETVMGVKRRSDDTWDFMLDSQEKIAYVRLSSFAQATYKDLLDVLMRLNNKKINKEIKGLILDLRFNPGGLLGSAVMISDMFIDDGRIVSIRPRAGREMVYNGEPRGKDGEKFTKFPMVVLVNGYSASGAEIVAACLQDHARALVMGTRSYGKGSVQTIQNFEGGKIKMTTASYWRPSGKNINRPSTQGKDDEEWGVSPDAGYELKLQPQERNDLYEHLRDSEVIGPKQNASKKDFKDRQLELALNYLRGQIKTASTPTAKKAG